MKLEVHVTDNLEIFIVAIQRNKIIPMVVGETGL